MKKRISKVLSVLFTLSLIISLFCGGSNFAVKAAGETPLLDKASSVTLDTIIDKSDGNKIIHPWSDSTNPPVVTYGDTLYVKLSWAFADPTKFGTDDVFTYNLPTEITFNDVPETDIYDKSNVVGKFSITKNVIKIQYTSATFCGNENRHGSLTFSGSIIDNGHGDKPEEDIIVTFPGQVAKTIHVKPTDIESMLKISKRIWSVPTTDSHIPSDLDATDKSHVYRTRIRVDSTGNNSNIKFRDDMWPGMTLLTAPEFYTDSNCSVPFEGASAFTNMDYSIGGDKVYFDIPSMGNTDYFYVTYLVLINRNMYSFATADEFLETNDPYERYPGRKYTGKVSNRATVISDETIARGYTAEQIRSWGDVGTILGAIDKWANPTYHKESEGIMNWEIILKTIQGSDYTSGYLIDVLPANVSLVENSVKVLDVNTGAELKNAVSINQEAIDAGKTKVTFTFSEELIKALKESDVSKYISYNTKIENQTEDEKKYTNTATIFYNGKEIMHVDATDTFHKPDDLKKIYEYDEKTAPNVEYGLSVNPAALDLDPLTDELILEDVMSSSYELVFNSVTINGGPADPSEFTYDTESRKMTFKLKDKTSYWITYNAKVNLLGDEKEETYELTKENSLNSAHLYAIEQGTYDNSVENRFESSVYQSAASSSSDNKTGTLTVYKVRDDDHTKRLKDAKFTLTKMKETSNGSNVYETTNDVIEVTTDANGQANFPNLTRGVVYMLQETEAPTNFAKDTTLRFYAFEDPKVTIQSTITYNGDNYTLNMYDDSTLSGSVSIYNKLDDKTIQVLKTDLSGNGLAGVDFKLDDEDGKEVKKWTTSTTAESIKVTPGKKYTLTETYTPDDYEPITDKIEFTVTESGTIDLSTSSFSNQNVNVDSNNKLLLKIRNDKKKVLGSLKITKTITGLESGVNADGITFNVYKLDADGNISGNAIASFTYGDIKADGYKQIDDLELGKYRVVESDTAINGYDFKNTAAQTQVDIEVKATNTTTAPATGSLTNTYEKQKEYGSLKFIKTIAEQDVDGKAVANSNADSIVSKNSADNISFAVYRLDDNGNVDGSAVATFKYSDIKTDGYKQIDNLEVGKYRIVESNTAIDGYTLQNTNDEQKAEVEVKVSNVTTSPASVEITNTYKKNAPEIKYGSLKFIKSISEKDADGNDVDNSNSESIVSKSLANAITFELYKLDANGNVSGNAIASFTYGEISAAGYKQIDNLEVGKYRVVESSTDITGYNFKNADTEKQVDVEVTEQNTSSAPVEITLINKYEKQPEPKGSIKITKTITGPITENDKKNLTFTITDGTSEVWSGTLGDTSKFTEKSDGTYESVSIDNLDPKVEYTVTETLYDVTGLTETVTYKINGGDEKTGDTATGVKVTSNDTTTVDIKDVYDYEKFPVKVSKVDAGTGSEIAGAEIVLKDSDGKQIDKWTSTTTPHEIELPFGTYTLEETVAPYGYDKVESAITFTVDNTGKVTLDSAVTTGVSEVKSDGTIVIKDSPVKKDNSTTQSTTESTTSTTESTTEKTTESTTQATTEKQNDDDEDEDEDDDDSDDSTGDLVITVLDEKTKKPVPNAVITITRPDGTTGTYTTDENGQVVLTDVPTGDYVVTVTKVPDGYHVTTGKTSRVVVKKNKTTNYTEYIDTDSTTQTTTQAPNPAPGNSNNPPRNTSVRTGDDAAGKLPIAIFFAVISIVYIVAWVVYKAKKRKEDK